jgi:hypothetical protein
MAYVTPSTVTAGTSPITAAAQNIIVNDIINLRALANVQSTTVTAATFTRQANTFAAITGLSVSITPTSNTSKILIMASVNWGNNGTGDFYSFRLMRDSTAINVGDLVGTRPQVTFGDDGFSSGVLIHNSNVVFYDSPATTSATTYTIQCKNHNGGAGGIIYLNRTANDTDGTYARAASTITAWEIPA